MDISRFTIGLRITGYDSLAKCIAVLRKYTGDLSISELQKRIDNHENAVECSRIVEKDVRKINRCYKELVKSGAEVEIYDSGRRSSHQQLLNLIGSHIETAREVMEQMDSEAEE
ncbi:MAG: hypothetical protein IKN14_01885 [Clostridiales bacterium]|nr:hypothetical protein [Clostridiales bacterium]